MTQQRRRRPPASKPRTPKATTATVPAEAVSLADLGDLDHAQLLDRAAALGFEITDEVRALSEDDLRDSIVESAGALPDASEVIPVSDDPFAALRAELDQILAGRPLEQHLVLVGSAVMLLHGLRDEVRDVNAFVSPYLYSRLRTRWDEIAEDPGGPSMLEGNLPGLDVPVHVWMRWPFSWTTLMPASIFALSEPGPQGWPCVPLVTVRQWKAGCAGRGHALDETDIAAIDAHLEQEAQAA